MAQALPPFCPRCGAPRVPGQRFCANCGLTSVFVPPQNANIATSQPTTPFPPTVHPTMQEPLQGVPSWRNTGPPVSSVPPYPSKKRNFGRMGCALICLLLLVLLGVGGYIGAAAMGIHLTSFGSGNATQPTVTSTPINTTVTYAGVALTVLSAQQAQSFIDDPNTVSTGMVRLVIQEQNKTSLKVSWLYNDSARLLLPGKV